MINASDLIKANKYKSTEVITKSILNNSNEKNYQPTNFQGI